jgi:hypothetical protein
VEKVTTGWVVVQFGGADRNVRPTKLYHYHPLAGLEIRPTSAPAWGYLE